MLIPSETAKPLNSFLNWGLTLKLSDSFSLSSTLLSLLPSVRLLAKTAPFGATTIAPSRAIRHKDTDFCLSCNPERQNSGSENPPQAKSIVDHPPRTTEIKTPCERYLDVIIRFGTADPRRTLLGNRSNQSVPSATDLRVSHGSHC